MAVYSLLFGHAEWPEERKPCPRVYDEDERAASTARLNVSVPATLKGRVEASAALEGVPEDTWVARALARSVDPRVQFNS